MSDAAFAPSLCGTKLWLIASASAPARMQVAAGVIVAQRAEELRGQLAQLQVQQAQAETDIKGFMLAATGMHAMPLQEPTLLLLRPWVTRT